MPRVAEVDPASSYREDDDDDDAGSAFADYEEEGEEEEDEEDEGLADARGDEDSKAGPSLSASSAGGKVAGTHVPSFGSGRASRSSQPRVSVKDQIADIRQLLSDAKRPLSEDSARQGSRTPPSDAPSFAPADGPESPVSPGVVGAESPLLNASTASLSHQVASDWEPDPGPHASSPSTKVAAARARAVERAARPAAEPPRARGEPPRVRGEPPRARGEPPRAPPRLAPVVVAEEPPREPAREPARIPPQRMRELRREYEESLVHMRMLTREYEEALVRGFSPPESPPPRAGSPGARASPRRRPLSGIVEIYPRARRMVEVLETLEHGGPADRSLSSYLPDGRQPQPAGRPVERRPRGEEPLRRGPPAARAAASPRSAREGGVARGREASPARCEGGGPLQTWAARLEEGRGAWRSPRLGEEGGVARPEDGGAARPEYREEGRAGSQRAQCRGGVARPGEAAPAAACRGGQAPRRAASPASAGDRGKAAGPPARSREASPSRSEGVPQRHWPQGHPNVAFLSTFPSHKDQVRSRTSSPEDSRADLSSVWPPGRAPSAEGPWAEQTLLPPQILSRRPAPRPPGDPPHAPPGELQRSVAQVDRKHAASTVDKPPVVAALSRSTSARARTPPPSARFVTPRAVSSTAPSPRGAKAKEGGVQEAFDLEKLTGRMYMGFRNERGQRDGYGVMHGRDGTTYAGQWAHEQREGQGALIFGGGVFEGQWVQGRVHGDGVVNFKNGDVFRGRYRWNQKHGRGVYRWADGAEEVGEYVEGKKHGWHSWRYRTEAWDILYEKGLVVAAESVPASKLAGSPRPGDGAAPHVSPRAEARAARRSDAGRLASGPAASDVGRLASGPVVPTASAPASASPRRKVNGGLLGGRAPSRGHEAPLTSAPRSAATVSGALGRMPQAEAATAAGGDAGRRASLAPAQPVRPDRFGVAVPERALREAKALDAGDEEAARAASVARSASARSGPGTFGTSPRLAGRLPSSGGGAALDASPRSSASLR